MPAPSSTALEPLLALASSGAAESSASFSGNLASVLTAFCWAVGAVAFAASGRMIGSKNVNRIRLVLAALLVGIAILLYPAVSAMFPEWGIGTASIDIPPVQIALLVLSGFLGLVFGDACYFECLVVLGARRAALLTMLTPVFVALLIVPVMGEAMTGTEVAGMVMTLAGVAWVILERSAVPGETREGLWRGIVLGVLGCVGQATGFLVAKAGLGSAQADSLIVEWAALPVLVDAHGIGRAGTEVHAMVGTFFRMGSAALILLMISLARRELGTVVGSLKHTRAMATLSVGTLFGPTIGVSLAMYALAHSNTAVASTIIATMPIMVIPIVVVMQKERVSWRAVLGSLLALSGVALLMGLHRYV